MCQIQAAPSAMYAGVPSVSNVRKPDRRNSARNVRTGTPGCSVVGAPWAFRGTPMKQTWGHRSSKKASRIFRVQAQRSTFPGERLCLVPLQQLVPIFRSSRCLAAHTFTNFGKSRALARVIILVPLFDLKSQRRVASLGAGTSDRQHQKRRISLQSLCRVRNEI